ncbi:MAG: SLBB domain-containing protein [Armatimonadetes bacterium]|nr:SLBB domain-containing protein [Armatimonadota bacterium]
MRVFARRFLLGLAVAVFVAAGSVGQAWAQDKPAAAATPAPSSATPAAAPTPALPTPTGEAGTTDEVPAIAPLPEFTMPPWAPVDPGQQFRDLSRFGAAVFEPRPPLEQETESQRPPTRAAETTTTDASDAATTNPEDKDRQVRSGWAGDAGTRAVGAPAPANYILGAGDVLSLSVWSRGREQHNVTLTVAPDGFVVLPLAGTLSLAGQPLSAARTLVANAFTKFYRDSQVTLVLSTQRAVDVYVLGDIMRPGKYNLVGMATVFTALYAAGGPSETGSFRQVRLERQGEASRAIDLYSYLMFGRRDEDVLLQSGDTIFIEPAKMEIGVAGEVRRPARYELQKPITLGEALQMAGGLGPQGWAEGLEVWRTGDHVGWSLVNTRAGADRQLELHDGDLVVVKPLLARAQEAINVQGLVRRPGVYALGSGLTVAQALRLAQGPAEGADMDRGIVWRLNAQMAYDMVPFSPMNALSGKPDADVALAPRDIVSVLPQQRVWVAVSGAVTTPGQYPFGAGMRVSDLVRLAGGVTDTAFVGRADLLRLQPDKQVAVLAVELAQALAGEGTADLPLQARDELQVKAREEAMVKSVVHVDGFVNEPGEYPRHAGMKVSDLIFAAGGLAPGASTIELSRGRVRGAATTEPLLVEGTPEHFAIAPDPLLGDDDRVSVQGHGDFQVAPASIIVKGQVTTQGAYTLTGDGTTFDTVFSVIQRAGGLLPDADPNGIVVYRGLAQTLPQMQDLAQLMRFHNREIEPPEDMEKAVTTATQQAMTDQVSGQLAQAFAADNQIVVAIPPRKLQVEQSVRSIPVDGARLFATAGRDADVRLEPGDVVTVPHRRDTVAVVGAVVRPGAVPYRAGMKVADCLAETGGAAADAELKRLVVLGPNGAARPQDRNLVLNPGDVILVPSQTVFRTHRTKGVVEGLLQTLAGAAALKLIAP